LYFLHIINTGDRIKFSCLSSSGECQTSLMYEFVENLIELVYFILRISWTIGPSCHVVILAYVV